MAQAFDNYKLWHKMLSKQEAMPNEDIFTKTNGGVSISTKECHLLSYFHLWYYRYFEPEFLLAKTKKIKSPIIRAWAKYCITHMDVFLEYENESFDSDLEDFYEYSSLSNEEIRQTLDKYKPYLFYDDYFRPAYEYIECEKNDLAVILIMMRMDSDYPYRTNVDHLESYCKEKFLKCNKKKHCKDFVLCHKERTCIQDRRGLIPESHDFEEEMCEFERDIIEEFVNNAPEEKKQLAYPFILNVFEQINATRKYKDPLITSTSKLYSPNGMPLTGKIYILWNKVSFYNGFYQIQHPKLSYKETSRIHTIKDANSRRVFNDISSYFLKKLPPIHVEVKDGAIVEILNKTSLDSCISVLEHKVVAPNRPKTKRPQMHTYYKRIELSKSEAIDYCKDKDSRYFKYLCKTQIEDYKVICCIENRVNASNGLITSEYSFIFTYRETSDQLFLAYENDNGHRCTYVFPIDKKYWKSSIDMLYDFFASSIINKRESLLKRLVDLKLPGNYHYQRIPHTDYLTWVDKMKHCH